MNKSITDIPKTIYLLKVIGSPFDPKNTLCPKNKEEAWALYELSVKNKISLSYLESIKAQSKLSDFNLSAEYEKEMLKYKTQSITNARVSRLLNSHGVNYAVFKSIIPFPATPNDVDIIHFGSDAEFEDLTNIMVNSNYIEIKGEVDASQRMFHDLRECQHLNPHKKDVYDIDIYQKISASRVVYIDKTKIEKYVQKINFLGVNINILSRETELMAIIIHSIVPEMLFTLLVYYTSLHYIKLMNLGDIDKFIAISQDNNVIHSVRSHFTLISELHQSAHGFVPDKVQYLLTKVSANKKENELLLKNNYNCPHMYSMWTVFWVLLEKLKEFEFQKSVINQILYMLNPKVTKWVITNIIWRRNRDTY